VIRFDTSVRIDRPVDDVFGVVSDPLQFPLWNSAVRAVRSHGGQAGEVGSTYSMERELPGGRVENELEIFAREPPREFGIRTTSGPTPFSYRYRFDPEPGGTVVHLDAAVELPGPAGLLGPIAGRAIKRGVDANLGTLKRILETTPQG
jgi:uncharacterized membrane protein